ncbi:MAG: NAD(P)/FAD-dependent oxidoreductase [Verrucomicrobiales bacterium]|nr:NAD(P)/FAD-dependent oxidoreductase [Verrucomicrobiales bacterium]
MQHPDYHVIILGGAFSGASLGCLLRRDHPEARILVVERAEAFDRKVGESTSEVAAAFMTRVLRISHHLNREHLVKQGLRLWFDDGPDCQLEECGEIGALYQSRLTTYQLDRSVLDEHLLAGAVDAGCELLRPAVVKGVELEEGGLQKVTVEQGGESRTLTARWVVDATGKAAMLARKLGHWRLVDSHPTKSMWGRFRGVRDLDGPEFEVAHPDIARRVRTARDTATNHLTGRGWWCWIIPLRGGEVSFGLTYDPRYFEPAKGGTIFERLLKHARQTPVGRWMFAEAEGVGTDMRAYGHLPYRTEQLCGDGWMCIGDAAGFMDPLYSQGLDYCSHTVQAARRLLGAHLGEAPACGAALADLNRQFAESYQRWFAALYEHKYAYVGDAELMQAAFLMDLACYFIGPVRLVYDEPETEWFRMPYFGPAGAVFARFMSFYNRRLAHLGNKRHAAGCYGRKNAESVLLIERGFVPDMKAMFRLLLRGAVIWVRAEMHGLTLRSGAEVPVPAGGGVMDAATGEV